MIREVELCVFFNQRDLFRDKIEAGTEWPTTEKSTDMHLPTALISIVQGYIGGGWFSLSKVFPEYNGVITERQAKFAAVDRRPFKFLTFVSCMLETKKSRVYESGC